MKRIKISIAGLALLSLAACTKLEQKLQSSIELVPGSANTNATALLNAAYNDYAGLLHSQDLLFSLQETTTDEALIPTRGGDWDDNGVWRSLHAHTWQITNTQFRAVFNALGRAESDAITVLAVPSITAQQRAEALFLRSVAQFYFVDLFGQVPYRPVSEYNSIAPAPVYNAQVATDTLVSVLTSIIPNLPTTDAYSANQDAARFLLMKVLLNRGAFINRAAPTFSNADMQQVITLGNQITATGKYSLTPTYFDNFGPTNAAASKEMIWGWPNNGSATINGRTAGDIRARWMMTLHYNSYDQGGAYGSAGWNGFTTVSDFYNTFGATDQRVGGTAYPGVTNRSGLKPGLVRGQQVNEAGQNIKDRSGNNLVFTDDVNLIEINANRLEVAGIRVIKYPPDYNAYTGGNQTNQLQIFRYADVLLMIAEAQLRSSTPNSTAALTIMNQLRAARSATPLTTATLVDANNVYSPNTLLAERGRELYFESWRRQDLIRFGVYNKPWALKAADDAKNLLYPIPPEQLIANPNLKQNPGY